MLQYLVDLVYPRICPCCAEPLNRVEKNLCFRCYEQLAFCPYLPHQIHPIEKILWGRCPLQAATSLLVFSKHGIGQKLLHCLKYKGDYDTGIFLGHLLANRVLLHPELKTVDSIIPIPLFIRKKLQRGYNQSEIIGKGVAEKMNLPVITDYLIKPYETASQTRKNRMERVENVSGAFALNTHFDSNGLKHVLVVDDVITTGSTLETCVNLLTRNHRVSVATLAYQ